MKPRRIATASDVIDSLGGTTSVARQLGLKNPRIVSNWRVRGLPPESYQALSTLLKAQGLDAPPRLWKQLEIVR